ncbi:MAG: hypothetical protein LBF87_07865 [Treponema sp.]|nr:hypothetical protein [Treponema sp.]
MRQVAGDIQTYGRIEDVQDKLPAMVRNIINAVQLDSSKFEKLAVLPVTLGSKDIDERVADTRRRFCPSTLSGAENMQCILVPRLWNRCRRSTPPS